MIEVVYLGRVDYGQALELQREVADLRQRNLVENTLLLLEHPPVLTLGRNAHRSNILATDEMLASHGVTVHEINRGGDVTYHGPGQLVGYPIFDLRSLQNDSGGRLGPVDFVRRMEEVLIRLCGHYGLPAFRIPCLTGVWCGSASRADGSPTSNAAAVGVESLLDQSRCRAQADEHTKDNPQGERKIAAIGIHVSRGVTSHGFAFNLSTNLDHFQLINPCGIVDRTVTSLALELEGRQPVPGLEEFAHQASRQFGLVFNQQMLAHESMAGLRRTVTES